MRSDCQQHAENVLGIVEKSRKQHGRDPGAVISALSLRMRMLLAPYFNRALDMSTVQARMDIEQILKGNERGIRVEQWLKFPIDHRSCDSFRIPRYELLTSVRTDYPFFEFSEDSIQVLFAWSNCFSGETRRKYSSDYACMNVADGQAAAAEA
ncbi:hypothetical protein BDQ12DRAFT_662394 [Crucibulum laeve]|uniref:Uncharacterized protein n=1 Tax=Crucibulum laeve TaxID=68775 RepID=A0A5C3MIR7_9AGAR|nr:hypothetical protein BDQ12DRAFT_662394 [Crucibulum laeve]